MVVRECEVGVRMRRRRGEGTNLVCDLVFDVPGVGCGVGVVVVVVVAVSSGEEGGDGVILVWVCCMLVGCTFEDDIDGLRRWHRRS